MGKNVVAVRKLDKWRIEAGIGGRAEDVGSDMKRGQVGRHSIIQVMP